MQPYKQHLFDNYNFGYYPTTWFDGGVDIYIGGDDREFIYEGIINAVGARVVPNIDLTVSMEWLGSAVIRVNVNVTNNDFVNYPPDAPAAPTGTALGEVDNSYEFSCLGTDPNRQQVYYKWDWGDGEVSDWLGPFDYGQASVLSHNWTAPGQYNITTQIKDTYNVESAWSSAGAVDIWNCGDVNDDNGVNILDVVFLINYKYKSGPPPIPERSGDVDNSGTVNILDVVSLINFKYKGGTAPNCPSF